MPNRHTPSGLLFVKKGLDQKRGCEDFVSRRVKQIRPRYVGGTNRLAFATTQTILDRVGDRADIGLLQDE